MIEVQNSRGSPVTLEIHKIHLTPKVVDYVLRHGSDQYGATFIDEDQIAWIVSNRPQEFVRWLDSLGDSTPPASTAKTIKDVEYDSKCICDLESYERAIEMGRKSGNMSNYLRVDDRGQPLPRHLQA